MSFRNRINTTVAHGDSRHYKKHNYQRENNFWSFHIILYDFEILLKF